MAEMQVERGRCPGGCGEGAWLLSWLFGQTVPGEASGQLQAPQTDAGGVRQGQGTTAEAGCGLWDVFPPKFNILKANIFY